MRFYRESSRIDPETPHSERCSLNFKLERLTFIQRPIWQCTASSCAIRSIGDLPLTFVDFDAMPLSIQSGEWQRPLMTLGIPLEVPSVELEFLIGRVVGEAHKVGERERERRERKRERKREPISRRKLTLSLSYWLPSAFAGTKAQTKKSNFINHTGWRDSWQDYVPHSSPL